MTITALPAIDFTRVGPPIGAHFPDVQLPDQRGREVDLHAERRGRPALVVVFRSAAW